LPEGGIGHEALQGIDGYGLIKIFPVAGGFTGMETYPPADRRERIFLLEKLPSLKDLALPDQNHGSLDILARGTPFIARRDLIIKTGPQVPPAPGFIPGHRARGNGQVRHILFPLEYDLLGHFYSLKPLGVRREA
jgi:hypothetical protein